MKHVKLIDKYECLFENIMQNLFFIEKVEARFYDKKQIIARWKFEKYHKSSSWWIYIDLEYAE